MVSFCFSMVSDFEFSLTHNQSKIRGFYLKRGLLLELFLPFFYLVPTPFLIYSGYIYNSHSHFLNSEHEIVVSIHSVYTALDWKSLTNVYKPKRKKLLAAILSL